MLGFCEGELDGLCVLGFCDGEIDGSTVGLPVGLLVTGEVLGDLDGVRVVGEDVVGTIVCCSGKISAKPGIDQSPMLSPFQSNSL